MGVVFILPALHLVLCFDGFQAQTGAVSLENVLLQMLAPGLGGLDKMVRGSQKC